MQTEFQIDPRGGHNRCNCNFDFFKKWTNEMAYVLGFLYADGCIIDAISSRTQYIQFASVDKKILEKIRAVIKSKHLLYVRPSRMCVHKNGIYKSRKSFILRIGSRRMFNDLICFGVIPRKSNVVKFPVVPSSYLNHFIRGYFDGDGCIYFYKTKGIVKTIIIKKLSVIFTSGSFTFLKRLGEILKIQLTLNHKKIYKSKGAFQLRYSTNDTLKIFKFLYKFCSQKLYLERKFNIFKNYFRLSPQKIDSESRYILKNLS